jgi:hypothetical protein
MEFYENSTMSLTEMDFGFLRFIACICSCRSWFRAVAGISAEFAIT